MPIIYNVTIKPVEKENLFNITWQDGESKTQISFINSLTIPQEDLLTGWEKASKHLEIGESLFDFLDGPNDTRYFSQVLEAAGLKKKIQINLRTSEETADWPYELIAKKGKFLLLDRVHLVRRVSDRGIQRDTTPVNDKIRLLFMACDFLDKDSGLNREKEEEAIKKITSTSPIEMDVEDSGALQGLQDRLVITSRFSFTLPEHGGQLLEERLAKVWLTSLRGLELDRKVRELKYIDNCKNSSMKSLLVNAGCGNPLLLEQIDRIAGQIPPDDIARLEAETRKTREDFIRELGLYELYRQCSEPLKIILERLRIYPNPVSEYHIQKYETKITEFPRWKKILREGINLGLAEHDQIKRTYSLTPLLKE
jgi:hypothetical protein